MENIIYNDLLRRGYNIDVGVLEHDFKKDGNRRKLQLEVDFASSVSPGNPTMISVERIIAFSGKKKDELDGLPAAHRARGDRRRLDRR